MILMSIDNIKMKLLMWQLCYWFMLLIIHQIIDQRKMNNNNNNKYSWSLYKLNQFITIKLITIKSLLYTDAFQYNSISTTMHRQSYYSIHNLTSLNRRRRKSGIYQQYIYMIKNKIMITMIMIVSMMVHHLKIIIRI